MDIPGKCLFLGSKALGFNILRLMSELVPDSIAGALTIDDRQDSRSVLAEFVKLAAARKFSLEILDESGRLARILENLRPDFVIVSGWYRLIPPELLTIPPLGFYGLHASALPAYRGNAPLVWQILNGEKQAGISLFKFDGGVDTGELLAQRSTPIASNDTIGDVLEKIEAASMDMIREYYPRLVAGEAATFRQSNQGGRESYCSLRRPEDGEIVWTAPAEQVHNFIRAQSRPYPGAFSFRSNREKIIFWRTRLFPHPFYGVPGRIDQCFDGGVVVACGQGAVIADQIYCQGADRPASGFLSYGETLASRPS